MFTDSTVSPTLTIPSFAPKDCNHDSECPMVPELTYTGSSSPGSTMSCPTGNSASTRGYYDVDDSPGPLDFLEVDHDMDSGEFADLTVVDLQRVPRPLGGISFAPLGGSPGLEHTAYLVRAAHRDAAFSNAKASHPSPLANCETNSIKRRRSGVEGERIVHIFPVVDSREPGRLEWVEETLGVGMQC